MINLVFIAFYAFMAISDSQAEGTSTSASAILITVDQSGKGDYKKIQEAIDSVASNNAELVFIRVKPGVYEEKVTVPADKPFITISGTKAADTVITWNDSGEIFESPTFSVLASDFVGRYLTIQVQISFLFFTYVHVHARSLIFVRITVGSNYHISSINRIHMDQVEKLWH